MRKVAVIGGGVIAVLVVIGVGLAVFVFSSLDSLVKKAIEQVGSEVAGVPVSVGGVKIALTEGKATLTGLEVGNPKGFKTDSLFKLKEITVAIDTGTITANPVVIKEILVSAPEVTVELGSEGSSNLEVLQRNLAGPASAPSSSASKPGDEKSDRKLVIDRLALLGGTVNLATPIPGAQASGRLGDIVLTGLGRNSGGATSAQVAEKVLEALVKASTKTVQNMGVGALVDGVAGKAGALVPGSAGDALKGVFGK
jgi:hypothetical protein